MPFFPAALRQPLYRTQHIGRAYAPPSENHTEAYVNAVCSFTGILPNEPINSRDRTTMVPLVAAMSKVENGVVASFREVEAGWELTGFDEQTAE